METVPHYLQIAPGCSLPDISHLAPFKTVVVLEANYTSNWQDEVSNWLVANGCRYMMAWGPNCSSWDDSVDYADMKRFADYQIPDDKFVMTTWHSGETLESVFWYCQFCANFSYDDIELTNTLILHISETEQKAPCLALFKRSGSLADREFG